jgi:RIO kinase 1
MFDPVQTDRRARRKRKPVARHIPKVAEDRVVSDLGELIGLEGGFQTTYSFGRYEEGWLLDSIRTFYEEELIVDVLAQVKGGKEASVYLCEAHPTTGADLLAVKVYRPRRFRNLRNDRIYRSGRDVLTAEGRAVKTTDHRVMRAIGKKTAFGVQVSHTSWLMHEYQAMECLHQAGGAVPQPIASTENAILMSYVGDAQMAAPTMNRVRLQEDQAERLYQELLRNVELMLQHDMVHGDLSAYNVLYWDGDITLIDFPQVVDLYANRDARQILERDVTRICEYFARQGVSHDPAALADDLWVRYGPPEADGVVEAEALLEFRAPL